jgi:hypothetical protein
MQATRQAMPVPAADNVRVNNDDAPRVEPAADNEADDWDDDHSQCEDLKSPITIRINAGVRVSSSSNVVVLAAAPSEVAALVAQAVVAGIREASAGRCGIPMVDEDGHPRPLRVEVDTGLEVNGVGNVVGAERVVKDIMRIRAATATFLTTVRQAGPGAAPASTVSANQADFPQPSTAPAPMAHANQIGFPQPSAAPAAGQPVTNLPGLDRVSVGPARGLATITSVQAAINEACIANQQAIGLLATYKARQPGSRTRSCSF